MKCQRVDIMRKHRKLRKPLRIALEVLACTTVFIVMIAIFAGSVLQESYKNYPPTDAEIAENPKLEIYRK